MAKLMLTLSDETYTDLLREANKRGIKIQELLRAVVVPDWLRNKDGPGHLVRASNVRKDKQ